MKIDFSDGELILIDILISQEISETHIEIHHCKNMSYKEHLKDRLLQLEGLQSRLKRIPSGIPQIQF